MRKHVQVLPDYKDASLWMVATARYGSVVGERLRKASVLAIPKDPVRGLTKAEAEATADKWEAYLIKQGG